jgi:glutamine cyclotransferase
MMKKIFFAALILAFNQCNTVENQGERTSGDVTSTSIPKPAVIPYTVVNIYPHDTAAFSQGLEFYKGELLESTGLYGKSTLRKVDVSTGKLLKNNPLDEKYFGEGITILHDTLYQLTWQEHEILIYNPETFQLIRKMKWNYDGWGITNDGTSLYMTDGSDKIYVVRPYDLKLLKIISVSDNLGPLNNLNELEYINGSIYANRLEYDYIVQINPANGFVTGTINLKDVLQQYSKIDLSYIKTNQNGAVLNGIAWNPSTKKMFVTGKLWPILIELQLQP